MHTHSSTHTHTQTRARTRKYTHTHARTLAHVHTHANTPKQTRAHTHIPARRHSHDTHAHIHLHADIHMTRAEGRTPPRMREPGNGADSEGWAEEREGKGMGCSESISAYTVITTTENSRYDVHSKYNEQSRTRVVGLYVGRLK